MPAIFFLDTAYLEGVLCSDGILMRVMIVSMSIHHTMAGKLIMLTVQANIACWIMKLRVERSERGTEVEQGGLQKPGRGGIWCLEEMERGKKEDDTVGKC